MHIKPRSVLLWLTCLAGAIFLSACDSGKCLPCGEGDPCPDLSGEYFGSIKSVSDSCDDWDLLEGVFYLRVLSQTLDENGDTALEMESKDLRGLWGTLSGYLCNSEESSYPKYYPFMVSDTSTGSDGSSASYHLTGSLSVATEGDTSSYSYTATLTIRITDADGNTCMLMGSANGDLR